MQSRFIHHKQLVTFGNFLALAYSKSPDLKQQQKLLGLIVEDWKTSTEIATDNRILTNVVAIIVETPSLFRSMDAEMQSEVKLMYLKNWRRSELIKHQIKKVSKALEESQTQPVLLIKGGLRMFDKLYPGVAHRYMADIDLFFLDPAILDTLSRIGYKSFDPNEFDLANVEQDYLDVHKTLKSHLPPVYSPDHPCTLEMHQHLVHMRAVKYCRENIFQMSVPIPEAPYVLSSNLVDQLIVNLLHATYGDKFTHHPNFRLRNILEGYLLFQKMTPNEQNEFTSYFDSIGRQDDVAFWKHLCLNYFDAQEFSEPISLKLRMKFFYHKNFGQSRRANAVLYGIYFVWRTLTKELWSPILRNPQFKKLENTNKLHNLLARFIGRENKSR